MKQKREDGNEADIHERQIANRLHKIYLEGMKQPSYGGEFGSCLGRQNYIITGGND